MYGQDEINKSIIELAAEAIISIDDSKAIRVFNKSAEKTFGYTKEEMIGQPLDLLLPDDVAGVHSSYVLNFGESAVESRWMGERGELRGQRKSGEVFPAEASISKHITPSGMLFTVILRDISERKQVEAQLVQSRKLATLGQLAAGIAHDFNNLLSVMIGNAEMLEARTGEDEKARHNVEALIKAVDRGSSLTNRLLSFSRKQNLTPQPTAINGLVLGLEDMLQRTLGETIDLRTNLGTGTCEALIDPHQLEDAMVNLAINARDAMSNGGVLTIETADVTFDQSDAAQYEEVTPGDYVQISFTDTGTGMTPEVLENVFQPFFTTKDAGEGSGLGLSMVYGLAKQSEGHITIYSEVDHGTTVNLYLPRSQEPIVTEDTNDNTSVFARGSESILIVEDDENVREIPAYILREQGYSVAEAKDGKQAIEHLQVGRRFDLVFTDLVLPGGMNGVEIAIEAKRIQPDIKVLYTSGYTENAVINSGKIDPGVSLVNKPYRRAELLEKVRAILDSADD